MTNRRTGPAPPRWRPVSLASGVCAATLLACVIALSGCSDKPPCDTLVETMCGAVGKGGCDRLKASPPTDADACAAVLADDAELLRQVDALKAATAALVKSPAPAPDPAPAAAGE